MTSKILHNRDPTLLSPLLSRYLPSHFTLQPNPIGTFGRSPNLLFFLFLLRTFPTHSYPLTPFLHFFLPRWGVYFKNWFKRTLCSALPSSLRHPLRATCLFDIVLSFTYARATLLQFPFKRQLPFPTQRKGRGINEASSASSGVPPPHTHLSCDPKQCIQVSVPLLITRAITGRDSDQ